METHFSTSYPFPKARVEINRKCDTALAFVYNSETMDYDTSSPIKPFFDCLSAENAKNESQTSYLAQVCVNTVKVFAAYLQRGCGAYSSSLLVLKSICVPQSLE